MSRISICIVNYRTDRHTIKCVKSILDNKPNVIFEIVIVNNSHFENSNNDLFTFIKKHKFTGSIKYIPSRNIGFGAACNLATRNTNFEVLYFINPDCVIESKSIWNIEELSNRDTGAVGVRILDNHGGVERSISRFPSPITAIINYTFLGKIFIKRHQSFWYKNFLKKKEGSYKVDWVSGAFMVIKKLAFEDINGFDENFFMYFEDVDICLRLKKNGYTNYYYSRAKVLHYKEQSKINLSKRNQLFLDARKKYFTKHYGFILGGITEIIIEITESLANLKHYVFNRHYRPQ